MSRCISDRGEYSTHAPIGNPPLRCARCLVWTCPNCDEDLPYPLNADDHDCTIALAGATLPGEPNAHPADAGEFAARWNASTPDRRDELVTQLIASQEQADRCLRNNHQATIEELTARRSHIIWYPLYDHPIDLRMSREQLQYVHDLLLGKPEVIPGWAQHFAGEIERVLRDSLDARPTPESPTGDGR